jgi:periplasmic protein CpxP/Spy
MMFKTIKPATFSFAAATLLGALALAAPLTPAMAQTDTAAPAAAPKSHAHKPAAAQNPEDRVEAHLADLKTKLKITDAEAAQWDALATVMRENAKEAEERVTARNANTSATTAVDDLKTYAAIAQGHADGVKKMETAFEALYAVMPDDQKKNADEVFAKHESRGERHRSHAKKPA